MPNGRDTRNKILEVAEREFASLGFAGAHLQRIAEQVGVQKTALYYYFPSKEALYVAVLRAMLEHMDEVVTRVLGSDGSYADRFARLLDAINDMLVERQHYAQILCRILVDRVRLEGQPLRPLIRELVGKQLEFYRAGIDAGEFAKLSPRHIYQTVLGATFLHYSTGYFGAAVLGVDDIFSHSAVTWRRDEARRLLLRAVLRQPS